MRVRQTRLRQHPRRAVERARVRQRLDHDVLDGARAFELGPDVRRRVEEATPQRQTRLTLRSILRHEILRRLAARDHGGQYPKSLDELVGKYMLDTPICPCAGSNTYGDLKYIKNPPGMSVSCSGGFHRKLFKGDGNPEHWPYMDSTPPPPKKKKK